MNRLPRRTARIQPPLRGRLATSLTPKQQQDYSLPVVRSRPTIPRKPKVRAMSLKQASLAENIEIESVTTPRLTLSSERTRQLEPVVTPHDEPQPISPQSLPQSRLWQWLIGLIVLLILLLVGGSLS